MLRDERVRQPIPSARVVIVEGVLTVPVVETTLGWMYKDAPLKIGTPLTFETSVYTMDGGVIDMTVAEADSSAKAVAPAVGAIR